MPVAARTALLCLLALGPAALTAQQAAPQEDLPYKLVRPLSDEDKARRQALKLYAQGVLHRREDRFIEAIRAFEQAAELDPQATAVYKALIPLYTALNRTDDALAACRKVLDINPKEVKVWYLYARGWHAKGQNDRAVEALEKGVAAIAPGGQAETAREMYFLLGNLRQDAGATLAAAAAFRACAGLLEQTLAGDDLPEFDRKELSATAAELYERMGKLNAQAREYDQAIRAYSRAKELYPPGAVRWDFHLAEVAAAKGDTEAALGYLDDYLRILPPGAEPYELKIELLTRAGRAAEILPWLAQAAGQDRHNIPLQLLLARRYAGRNLPARAEAVYVKVAEEYPQPEVYEAQFRLYKEAPGYGAGRILTAVDGAVARADDENAGAAAAAARVQAQAMISALRKDPGTAAELVRAAFNRPPGADLQPRTVRLLAALADQNRQPREAERFYRLALAGATPQNEALIYSGLLRALWRGHRYEEVLDVCDKGLAETEATNHILFHSDRARALARLGRTDDALRAADKAVSLSASDADRLSMEGLAVRLLSQAGRHGEAERRCEKLLDRYRRPGEVLEVRYLLSTVHSAARNFPKAEEELQLILKSDPENATAHNDLGYIWADQGKNLAEAERLIRRALELDREQRKTLGAGPEGDGDHAAYVDSLGWVLFRRGLVRQAREQLEKATRLPDGEDPVIWDHLGDVYFTLEMPEEAARAWRQAVGLYEEQRVRGRDQRYEDLKGKIQLLQTTSE